LNSLYKELSALKAKNITCFIDACFSGTTRENEMLLAGRGVVIKVKEDVPRGNVVVFTSATGDETAHQYKEKKHGLFTYYLLKKLKESKGNVTLGELGDYITTNVKRTSFDVNNKIQTPTVIPSTTMMQKWRNIKL
ncbi:MAG: caspase family protein, partial [Bacteroidales bacterium]|nr:caspase family protein [Bacteroidales bacterium]